jgi:hypothetical protein
MPTKKPEQRRRARGRSPREAVVRMLPSRGTPDPSVVLEQLLPLLRDRLRRDAGGKEEEGK